MAAAADVVVDVDDDADVGLALSTRSSKRASLASTAERSPDAAGIPDSISLGGLFSDLKDLLLSLSGPAVFVFPLSPVRIAVLAVLSASNFSFNLLCLCRRRSAVFLDRLSPVRTGGGKGFEFAPAVVAVEEVVEGALDCVVDLVVGGAIGLGSTTTSGVDIGDSA